MHLISQKLSKLGIGWNERTLTEADLYRICKRFKIGVAEMSLTVGGFYYRVAGRDHIAVDSKLSATKKLLVLFHELGHFLLHTPDSGATANFHGVGRRSRKEIEADAFALCAIIPKALLETRTIDELIDEGIDPEALHQRIEIYRIHQI